MVPNVISDKILRIHLVAAYPATQGPTPQEFFCLVNLSEGPCGLEFRPENLPRQDMVSSIPAFSKNGKWMIRAGTYGYFGTHQTRMSTL